MSKKKIIFYIIIPFLIIGIGVLIFYLVFYRGCYLSFIAKELGHSNIYTKMCSAWSSNNGKIVCQFKNVHARSLQTLDYRYSKDKNNVYYGCEKVKGADPSTFMIWGKYAMDKNNIFINDELINLDNQTITCEQNNPIDIFYRSRCNKDGDCMCSDGPLFIGNKDYYKRCEDKITGGAEDYCEGIQQGYSSLKCISNRCIRKDSVSNHN